MIHAWLIAWAGLQSGGAKVYLLALDPVTAIQNFSVCYQMNKITKMNLDPFVWIVAREPLLVGYLQLQPQFH